MKPPEFPKDFAKHCPKVDSEMRQRVRWTKNLTGEKLPYVITEDDEGAAECSFHRAGAGMACENCSMFLTRPYLGHKLDEEFLPQIEQYYNDLIEYEKWLEKQKSEQEKISQYLGSGI